MIWAQAFPFVALQFFEEGSTISKGTITLILIGSFSSWLLLNVAFFCTIDLSYLGTFFGTKTAPQYTCEYFSTSKEDFQKWDAVFENQLSYTTSIHNDVRTWVSDNIVRWQQERPQFFKIEMIPDDLLPRSIFEAEGGVNRRRSSVREIVGLEQREINQVHPEQ